ncbi:MAG: hypothetical protein OEO77_06325 [Acidimicrobiia bacterium]|nr:hypothetical protein [Acidimicrobiia bacterium]
MEGRTHRPGGIAVRLLIPAAALVVVAAACGGDSTSATTTAGATTTTTTTTTTTVIPTTIAVTTTVPSPRENPWGRVLGEVSAPRGWTVEPCDGEDPFLCVSHDGATSRVGLDVQPLGTSGFADLLTTAGAPPGTTDLGAAAARPAIQEALQRLAELMLENYTETMERLFPGSVTVLEDPVVAPMGELSGYRVGFRVEDADGALVAWSVRHLAFDGEAVWLVTADFAPPPGEGGFVDLDTLLEMDPHLTLMMRSLAVGPKLPGTQASVVELLGADQLPPAWQELFAIPYGPAIEELGTGPGGDSGSLNLGPEFGTQAPDGTWWFLDGAKRRLAHYSSGGSFLDAVALPPEYLVRGEFFPWRLPHALDDGALVATQLDPDWTTLLVLRGGQLSTRKLSQSINVKLDDGVALYGLARDGMTTRIDPETGEVEEVDWFVTRNGTRFQLWVSGSVVTLWLPDTPPPTIRQLRLVYGPHPEDKVYASLEAAGGAEGSIHLYLLGGTDSGAGGQLGGFLTISADGAIAPIEAIRAPDPNSDPGSPAHLGADPTTGTPWLMYVDQDAVRVFQRLP